MQASWWPEKALMLARGRLWGSRKSHRSRCDGAPFRHRTRYWQWILPANTGVDGRVSASRPGRRCCAGTRRSPTWWG